MDISRYKKPIILFTTYCAFVIFFFLIIEPYRAGQDLSPFIPGIGFAEVIILLIVLYPLSSIIGVLFGYLLSPVYLLIHKKTFGIRMIYGIQEVPQSQKFRKTFQAIFPSLLAIHFSLIISFQKAIANAIVGLEDVPYESMIYIIASITILTITLAISIALFASGWFLLDAGIKYSNREKFRKKSNEEPIEGRSVGMWYINIFKGYAGIAIIFTYYQLISLFIIDLSEGGGQIPFIAIIANVILLFPLAMSLSIASIPAIILLDILRNYRINFVRKIALKLGITYNIKITFEEIPN